jgi:SagB-type dehydrogenase family enzyme
VSYWRDGALRLRNYATGEAAIVSPVSFLLLDFCNDWRTIDEIAAAIPMSRRATIARAVQRLTSRTFLERSDRPRDARVEQMRALDPWNPEAGFFHTATRNVRFWSERQARAAANAKAEVAPMPPVAKRYRRRPTVRLPLPRLEGSLSETLLARRTWRRFAAAPVTISELATVLGFSAGIQWWAKGLGGELPLKTSPSGGARHPIECYVVARRVRGLAAGIYHYSSDRHELVRLRGRVTSARLRQYLPRSEYFAQASALVFFTAVFARQLWRYPYSRAYRAALIEAGHVCQTFLLTATALHLAPFSLMGLADTPIEQDLGIDGITESVLYVAGFGLPPGSTLALLPRGTLEIRRNPRFV